MVKKHEEDLSDAEIKELYRNAMPKIIEEKIAAAQNSGILPNDQEKQKFRAVLEEEEGNETENG